MTFIIPDPRWEEPNLLIPGRKPVGPVKIDWENPLTRGLLDFYLCDRPLPRNLVEKSDHMNTNVGGGGVMNGEFLDFEAGSRMCSSTASQLIQPPTDYPVTLFLEARRVSSGAGFTLSVNAGIAYGSLGIEVQSTGVVRGFVYPSSFNSLTGDTWPVGETRFCVFVAPSSDSSTWCLYTNGVRVDAGRTGTVAWLSDTLTAKSLGGLNRGADVFYKGMHKCAGTFSRAMTSHEVLKFSKNPYQFLIPA